MITFKKAYSNYLEYAEIKQKPTSLITLRTKLEKNFLPYFENVKINSLSLDKYLDWQKQIEKKGYSYSYKRNLHYCVVAFYNYLQNFEGIKKNIPKIIGNFKNSYYEESKNDFWTYEEFKRFINVIPQDDIIYKSLFEFLFFTGCRKSEVFALTFNDIQGDIININKSLSKDFINGKRLILTPKTKKSIRKIQIDSNIKNKISNLHDYYIKKHGVCNDNFYIFGGLKPIPPTTLGRKKDYYCKIANVKNIRIHDFRHSHASMLYDMNISVETISKRLGHSNIRTTLETYIHITDNEEKRAIALLSSLKY